MSYNLQDMKTLKALQEAMTPKLTKYIPHYPTPKQAAFLLVDDLEVFFGGAAAGGKELLASMPIRTPTGWKEMHEIHPGDYVFDDEGSPTMVLAESEIVWDKPCYKITLDDKTEIICTNTHPWVVTTHVDAERNNYRLRVMTTEEMYQLNPRYIRGYKRKNGVRTPYYGSKYRIPVAKPLQYEEKDLPIHPYLLGIWLGDGSRHNGVITTIDIEIVDKLAELGYEVTKYKHGYDWRVRNLRAPLRELGLLSTMGNHKDKFIPEIYLQSSFDQRLELLRGLMDSDGTIERGQRGATYFCNTEKSLVDDVEYLLRTLGYKVKTAYECEYRLYFTPDPEHPPFHLEKKKRRLNKTRKPGADWYFIKSIEPHSSVPTKCIAVDSKSHMYLCGRELIPTHNSDALLMAALQYVDEPNYRALLLRRTFKDLSLPGALMDRAREWLGPFAVTKEVRWNEQEKTYIFPSGSTITFGYLEHENDKYRYQSAEFQFIGFDELTQFSETQYRYLFSRLRRLEGSRVPIRMRSASNPDGVGIVWVHQRFVIEGIDEGRIFIPSKLEDNPHVDQEAYERSLEELDPLTRMRLRHGVWALDDKVGLFKREWFVPIMETELPSWRKRVRYWDFASTDPKKQTVKAGSATRTPDWSVGLLLSEHRGLYYIEDVVRAQVNPDGLEKLVRSTAEKDGHQVSIGLEQEPGSSGKIVIDHYARNVLKGYVVYGNKETGSKVLRATPSSAIAERGHMFIVKAPWNGRFLDELEVAPYGEFDDQMDALSGAQRMLRDTVPEGAVPIGVDDGRPSYWRAI